MLTTLSLRDTGRMSTWGSVLVGGLWFVCGVIVLAADGATRDGYYLPVAALGLGMTVVGAVITVVGVIGTGVKVGNEATRR